jgi:hypothetical protein
VSKKFYEQQHHEQKRAEQISISNRNDGNGLAYPMMSQIQYGSAVTEHTQPMMQSELEDYIIVLYSAKPRTLSSITDQLDITQGPNWAANLDITANSCYSAGDQFVIQTLQKANILSAPRTLESMLGDTMVREILSLWDQGYRSYSDIANAVYSKKEYFRWFDAPDGPVLPDNVEEVLLHADRIGMGYEGRP